MSAPEDEASEIIGRIEQETQTEHSDFDRYEAAVLARVQDVLTAPQLGGVNTILEDLANPDYERKEKEDHLLSILALMYRSGVQDAPEITSGHSSDPNIRNIAAYKPEVDDLSLPGSPPAED